MPIYEFACAECRHEFEELVHGGVRPPCPKCGSAKVEKKFSTFAVAGASGKSEEPPPGACGRCGDPRGPGACSMN